MSWTYALTVASIIGTVANVYKKRWCFIVWLFTNGAWMIVDAYEGLYAQSILFAVYVVLAVVGIVKWRKDEKSY